MDLLPVPVPKRPSAYEQQAFAAIQAWKQPSAHWLARTTEPFNRAVAAVSDQVRKIPGFDWTVDNVVSGLLTLLNEITQDFVWRDAIYKAYRTTGYPFVTGGGDLFELDLETIDGQLKGLSAKYCALAAAEGAATGAAGGAGVLPDIVALIALNLRAAGEYATYCGFDLTDDGERLYALRILDAVTRPQQEVDQITTTPVPRLSGHVARQQTVQAVEQYALTRAMQTVARAIAIRLTRLKLSQLLPLAGAVVAGGINTWYTKRVCETAHHLYRERFLLLKYEVLRPDTAG